MMKIRLYYKIILSTLVCLFLAAVALTAQGVSVEAGVENSDLIVGESVIYQIKVNGTNKAEQPNIGEIPDFTATYNGSQPNNSQSITIINGKMTQKVDYSIVFQYTLMPQKTGSLTIPSVLVKAEGKSFMTDPVTIRVSKATETGDYKLRLFVSKNRCYVGEKLVLSVTWYFTTKVGSPQFNIPFLGNKDFSFYEPAANPGPNKEYVTVNVGGGQAKAKYGTSNLGGVSYTSVTFERILLPKKSGTFEIPQSTIEFQGVSGYRNVSDFFGNMQRQEVVKQFVIPSNTLSINVLPMPEDGKPANFSGLIGSFSLSAAASPTEVRVGDPITLTLTLRGEGNVEDARLPPLDEMYTLNKDFKIPKEMSPGETGDGKKTFTQTLRALRADIKAIPQIELPFFNTRTGRYEVARTNSLPLSVSPASRELSASDFEGNKNETVKREVEVWSQGIAANYESRDVLVNQAYGLFSFGAQPLLIVFLLIPVLVYIALLSVIKMNRIASVPQLSKRVKKAVHHLESVCRELEAQHKPSKEGFGKLLDSLKSYIGIKLGLKGSSLTFKDIETRLGGEGLDGDTLKKLKDIFATCEAAYYAGGAYPVGEISGLVKTVDEIVSGIERSSK